MIKIVTEQEVKARVDMAKAVAAIEQVMVKVAEDNYLSPPRHYIRNDNGAITFTIGGDKAEGVLGFRVYDTFPTDIQHEQFVAVFDAKTGALNGIVLGAYIGAIRTGALGGAAVKALSRQDSRKVGIIGSGLQARTQLLSTLAVRDIDAVQVFSRNPENCEAFVKDMQPHVSGSIAVAASRESAVEDADIVILATNSSEPVIDVNWLKPGTHLNTVGPKFKDRHELPAAIGDKATQLFTDALPQLRSDSRPHFLVDHPSYEQIADLPKLIAGQTSWQRSPDDITVYLSVGLSGTEPAIANLFL